MPLIAFDHVNIQTANLEEMVHWYDDVLGLKSGKRPAFPFPGAWLYLGDTAIVHLVGSDTEPKAIEPKLEHFAISAQGKDDFLAHLQARGIKWQIAEVPGFGITQVNIWDPDGNHIHVDFSDGQR